MNAGAHEPQEDFVLQFVRARGILSRGIAWFGGLRYSHVDLVLPDGSLLGARSNEIVTPQLEWIPSGVQIRPWNYGQWVVKDRFVLRGRASLVRAAYAWARRQIGCPYDSKAIWGFALDRDWREENAWFCAELAARALEVGFGVRFPLTTSKIAPGACAMGFAGMGARHRLAA